ncbi:hypothetical protein [Halomicrobium salinisoli]|uniref:hypothetical protein n=1 Tax=Halomicrobium salinisoli TaxID=2878391 RepID=UPI001CF0D3A9|nr:hypothetical protein [Halomicrobium salinisoli]
MEEIDAGIDPYEPVGFERPPEWHVKSVTIGEEEYPVSSGNGIDMVETIMPVERLLQETRLGHVAADHVDWRIGKTNVQLRGARKVAGYLADHGVTHPWVADEIISVDHVPDPDQPGTISVSELPDDTNSLDFAESTKDL